MCTRPSDLHVPVLHSNLEEKHISRSKYRRNTNLAALGCLAARHSQHSLLNVRLPSISAKRRTGSMASKWSPAGMIRLSQARDGCRVNSLKHAHHHFPKRAAVPHSRDILSRSRNRTHFASTSSQAPWISAYPATRAKNALLGTTILTFLVIGYLYVTDTRAGKSRVC